MRVAILAGALALCVTTSAAADPITDYTIGRFPVIVDGRTFIVAVSKKSPRLLIQAKARGGDIAPADWPLPWWRAAAEKFVQPVGCGIPAVEVKWKLGGTWEADYACPEGVDLKALATAQKAQLKGGQPLTSAIP